MANKQANSASERLIWFSDGPLRTKRRIKEVEI